MTKEQIYRLFRENMRLYREELGISQSELARRMRTTPGYICDFERGRRRPNIGTLALIAQGLGVAPASLISTVRSRVRAI